MKVINLIAGPSAGKSVLAAQLFASLKIDGVNAEYVPEYAKWQVWTGDTEALNNQYHLVIKQFNMINALTDSVSVAVTDGSLVHGLAYNILNKDNTSDVRKTQETIMRLLEKHDNRFFFIDRGSVPYQQDGRLESFTEARDVDNILKVMMNRAQIPYTCVCPHEEGFEAVYAHIIDEAGL